MKYMELILIMILLPIFSLFISSTIKTYKRLSYRNQLIIKENDACYFISESFKNTCKGKGFESLCQWQKECAAMWNLKYIGWCDAKDFLPISNDYNIKILYGKWIGENFEGEVYWEVENEK